MEKMADTQSLSYCYFPIGIQEAKTRLRRRNVVNHESVIYCPLYSQEECLEKKTLNQQGGGDIQR